MQKQKRIIEPQAINPLEEFKTPQISPIHSLDPLMTYQSSYSDYQRVETKSTQTDLSIEETRLYKRHHWFTFINHFMFFPFISGLAQGLGTALAFRLLYVFKNGFSFHNLIYLRDSSASLSNSSTTSSSINK